MYLSEKLQQNKELCQNYENINDMLVNFEIDREQIM